MYGVCLRLFTLGNLTLGPIVILVILGYRYNITWASYIYIYTGLYTLQWLCQDFLRYLDDWERSVQARQGFTTSQKAMMTLSRETTEGLRMTGLVCLQLLNSCFKVACSSCIHGSGAHSLGYTWCNMCSQWAILWDLSSGNRGIRVDEMRIHQWKSSCIDNTVSLRVQGSAALEPLRENYSKEKCTSFGWWGSLA